MKTGIPEKIHSANVYSSGNRLVGISGAVTLPDFESMTETLSGPGILGEIDSPATGHFSGQEMEIPFNVLYEDVFALLGKEGEFVDLTLRASIQVTSADGGTDYVGMRVVVRGKIKSLTGGKIEQAKKSEPSIKIALYYILIEIDGQPMVELDKLNYVYKIGGVDQLAKVRAQI